MESTFADSFRRARWSLDHGLVGPRSASKIGSISGPQDQEGKPVSLQELPVAKSTGRNARKESRADPGEPDHYLFQSDITPCPLLHITRLSPVAAPPRGVRPPHGALAMASLSGTEASSSTSSRVGSVSAPVRPATAIARSQLEPDKPGNQCLGLLGLNRFQRKLLTHRRPTARYPVADTGRAN